MQKKGPGNLRHNDHPHTVAVFPLWRGFEAVTCIAPEPMIKVYFYSGLLSIKSHGIHLESNTFYVNDLLI